MRLMIVGSLNGQLGAATKIALDRGAKVVNASNVHQAMAELRAGRGADLLMVEVSQPISELVKMLNAERIHVPIVACGIGTDARAAVDAIRSGAKEYVPLPPDATLIAAVLEAVADESHQLIFEDRSMEQVIAFAEQVAPSEASILITGESGTGKEVLARFVHRKSARSDKPFISVNCAAIPENLLESELFGHEKGSFTGAVARRVGKFEEADGGTLLLDEISEMDVRLQAKLLRALQEREIDRVGGGKPVKVNIRVIATSNRDLQAAVKAGAFREDLLYRLNVVNLRLPALRERKADIVALAKHFSKKYSAANGVPDRAFDATARAALLSHPWRGNVRELENTIHRAVLLARGPEITEDAIRMPDGSRVEDGIAVMGDPAATRAAQTAESITRSFVGRTVSDMERDLIIETLSHCLGNRTHAANILGISIRTLRNKLKEYTDAGVKVPPPGANEMRVAV
ncbi:Regulatory protein AtoC [Alphaproteobacteria bacterium SO-S41]|nr:Regulatory protein AtoC [Alphaproteobacteria bacterium SO-S41]